MAGPSVGGTVNEQRHRAWVDTLYLCNYRGFDGNPDILTRINIEDNRMDEDRTGSRKILQDAYARHRKNNRRNRQRSIGSLLRRRPWS